MQRLCISCVGISPLLLDNASPTHEAEVAKARSSDYYPLSARQIATSKLLSFNQQGILGIPSEMLWEALLQGSIKLQQDPRKCSRVWNSLVEKCLKIEVDFIPLTGPNGESDVSWEIDRRRGLNARKNVIAIVRPRFDKWGFITPLVYDSTKIIEAKIEELLNYTGRAIGLGSYSRSEQGIYGRFAVRAVER